jgi:2-dehydro-3-deoxyphosphogluconate aldolase/(4S)-4-hydroxy-2-oxoglutarate aldolase
MDFLGGSKILPVLVAEDASWMKDLGRVLVDNGLPLVEVTLRTEASWKAIENLIQVDGLTVGVGSVTREEELDLAKKLNLKFAVSAGLSQSLVSHAKSLGIPYLPGVATATEILTALRLGVSEMKWFPAMALGGAAGLRAISAPFPAIKFLPTGGISLPDAQNLLKEKNVIAVGGSWIFSKADMASRDLASIAKAIKASTN